MTSIHPNLLIIDGFNLLYRAFHGNEPLTGPGGQPTGAIHGFLRSVAMLEKQYPGYATIVTLDPFPAHMDQTLDTQSSLPQNHWDKWNVPQLADLGQGPSRWDIYPQYKGTRSEMPHDLRLQLVPLILILHGRGVPMLQGNHFAEADDLLATLATSAKTRGIPTVVCSGDKDVLALVDDAAQCRVFNPNTNKEMREQDVMDKYGVHPKKMEDFLALMGDTVDNIPGVNKCGPKTAAKWLDLYGNLEGIIANADAIKGVVGEHLRAALPNLPLSKSLTSLKRDLPLDFHAALQAPPQDTDLLTDMYTALGMKSALAKLQAATPTPAFQPG